MGLSRSTGRTKPAKAKEPMPPLPIIEPKARETKRKFFSRVFAWIRKYKPEVIPPMPPLPVSHDPAQRKVVVDKLHLLATTQQERKDRRLQNEG